MSGRLLRIQTGAAQAVDAGRWHLEPLSRSVSLHLPGGAGGFLWSRPVAVRITAPGEKERVVPVRDVTRWLQVLIPVGALGLMVAWWALIARPHRSRFDRYVRARRC